MAGKYLSTAAIQDLIQTRDRIFAEHHTVWQQHQIDILANDTLSSLSIWEIVSEYDPNYNTNFHRNGEDAMSGGIAIEQKCATVKPAKKGTVGRAGFQFHAQGKLEYERYIFAVRRKDNLKIVRLWDVSSPAGIQLVQTCLQDKKQNWIDRGKPNHDAILVEEKNLMTLLVQQHHSINDCQVYRV